MLFTQEEARAYLKWLSGKEAEYHYLARFKTTRPFVIDYPDAYARKAEAKVVLGLSMWQRTFDQVRSVWPTMPFCKYISKRIELNIS